MKERKNKTQLNHIKVLVFKKQKKFSDKGSAYVVYLINL